MIFFLKIIICVPFIYMMDYPDLTVSNLMEISIGLKRAIVVNTKDGKPIRLINTNKCTCI